ncbi:MAG: cellulase family glycosylhydrolase [Puniceicoccaceae bacterium]
MNRRNFFKTGAVAAAATSLGSTTAIAKPHKGGNKPGTNPLPRWRGFNLMAFFTHSSTNEQYRNRKLEETDLKWIRDWGFDYVRLPFSYWHFVDGSWKTTGKMDPADIRNLDEEALEQLDKAVEQCVDYGLHITVNMHRAPGYCINNWELEPFNLFKEREAEDAFAFFWDMLAKRYKGISNKSLSFNLVNEAPRINEKMSKGDYRRVMLRARDAIHAVSPKRTIIIDGTGVGREVVYNMLGENVAQAFHAYDPFHLTHYKAHWAKGSDEWKVPEYPYPYDDGTVMDRRHLAIEMAPWAELVRQGTGVHCGECGCYNKTPHKVFLRWFEDVLDLLKQNDIGWGLWNFRGNFGILDSGRTDVDYKNWHGHKLDRKLLNLLRKY